MMVLWPTSTPGTSVIAFQGPVGIRPIGIPRSRRRGRGIRPLLGRSKAVEIQRLVNPVEHGVNLLLAKVSRMSKDTVEVAQRLRWRRHTEACQLGLCLGQISFQVRDARFEEFE